MYGFRIFELRNMINLPTNYALKVRRIRMVMRYAVTILCEIFFMPFLLLFPRKQLDCSEILVILYDHNISFLKLLCFSFFAFCNGLSSIVC